MNTPSPLSRIEDLGIKKLTSREEAIQAKRITEELKDSIRTQIQKTLELRSQNEAEFGSNEYPQDGVDKGVQVAQEKIDTMNSEVSNMEEELIVVEGNRTMVLENLEFLQGNYEMEKDAAEDPSDISEARKLLTPFLKEPDEYRLEQRRELVEELKRTETTQSTTEHDITQAIEQLIGIDEIKEEIEKAKQEKLDTIEKTYASINTNAIRARNVLSQETNLTELIQQNALYEAPDTDPEELKSFVDDTKNAEQSKYVDNLWDNGPKRHLEDATSQLKGKYEEISKDIPDLETATIEAKDTYHTALEDYKELSRMKMPFLGKKAHLQKLENAKDLVRRSHKRLLEADREFSDAISQAFTFITNFHGSGTAFQTRGSFVEEYMMPEVLFGLNNSPDALFGYNDTIYSQWKKVGGSSRGEQMKKDLSRIQEDVLKNVPASKDFPWIKKLNKQRLSYEEFPKELNWTSRNAN